MTHITKYLHFPKKKITHIKRDCPKSHFISKNSSITSCHLLLSLPEGKHPEWGREFEKLLFGQPPFFAKKEQRSLLAYDYPRETHDGKFPIG